MHVYLQNLKYYLQLLLVILALVTLNQWEMIGIVSENKRKRSSTCCSSTKLRRDSTATHHSTPKKNVERVFFFFLIVQLVISYLLSIINCSAQIKENCASRIRLRLLHKFHKLSTNNRR